MEGCSVAGAARGCRVCGLWPRVLVQVSGHCQGSVVISTPPAGVNLLPQTCYILASQPKSERFSGQLSRDLVSYLA